MTILGTENYLYVINTNSKYTLFFVTGSPWPWSSCPLPAVEAVWWWVCLVVLYPSEPDLVWGCFCGKKGFPMHLPRRDWSKLLKLNWIAPLSRASSCWEKFFSNFNVCVGVGVQRNSRIDILHDDTAGPWTTEWVACSPTMLANATKLIYILLVKTVLGIWKFYGP